MSVWYSTIQPFTHSFPRADIHVLLTSDLLHKLIKGTFKDHLVTWVEDYFFKRFGKARRLEIIGDVNHWYVGVYSIKLPCITHQSCHRISAVPPYPGLQCFPDGRDFNQWTGDDSKALIKVSVWFKGDDPVIKSFS